MEKNSQLIFIFGVDLCLIGNIIILCTYQHFIATEMKNSLSIFILGGDFGSSLIYILAGV